MKPCPDWSGVTTRRDQRTREQKNPNRPMDRISPLILMEKLELFLLSPPKMNTYCEGTWNLVVFFWLALHSWHSPSWDQSCWTCCISRTFGANRMLAGQTRNSPDIAHSTYLHWSPSIMWIWPRSKALTRTTRSLNKTLSQKVCSF